MEGIRNVCSTLEGSMQFAGMPHVLHGTRAPWGLLTSRSDSVAADGELLNLCRFSFPLKGRDRRVYLRGS